MILHCTLWALLFEDGAEVHSVICGILFMNHPVTFNSFQQDLIVDHVCLSCH